VETWGFVTRIARKLRQHRDVVRFCLRFSLYSILAFGALFALQDQVVEPFTRGIAWVAYKLMRMMGTHVWLSGVTLGVENFAVQIRNNCNAAYEMGLYTAASLAYPAAASERATGILLNVAVLYVVNLVRILSLVYLGHLLPGFFEAAHVYVWQVLFLVVVAALWLHWVGRVRPVA
jgi:exosortase H (IPTLxxWG-CTERM-specific)